MNISQKLWNSLIIVFVILFSVYCAFQVKHLRFDYDFEAFFPNEDSELEIYEQHRKQFEWDNEFVLLGIENKQGIFKKDFLLKIDSLTKELQQIADFYEAAKFNHISKVDAL